MARDGNSYTRLTRVFHIAVYIDNGVLRDIFHRIKNYLQLHLLLLFSKTVLIPIINMRLFARHMRWHQVFVSVV